MNKTAIDIAQYWGISKGNELKHVGVAHDENPPGRGSGRYGFGTGKTKFQHVGREFYDLVNEYRKQGLKETEIAEKVGALDIYGKPSSGRLRDMYTVAQNRVRIENVNQAKQLREEGKTLDEIAEIMGLPGDSSVRSLLNGNSYERSLRGQRTADEIKRLIEEKGPIDIGAGAEGELSIALGTKISETRLAEALYILEEEGYVIDNIRVPQVTNAGQKTTTRVIAAPGTDKKEFRNFDNIHSITDYISHDEGDTLKPVFAYPESLNSDRIMVRYSEDGGLAKDGVVEIRRGVEDLSLGNSHYAQVRILVDGTHYIKGMAVYSDDMPHGVDVIFNTNKHKGTPLCGDDNTGSVLKTIKSDPTNPFGSLIKDADDGGQYYYFDKDGNEKLGLINKTREEGEWDTWKDKLPSQFLSKQPQKLIDNQLNMSISDKKAELDEINSLTNPTLKKKLLLDYAGKCDTAAVDLKASSLPGQKYHVILPLTTVKDNEIYAPNYKDGEYLALVRFPHAGPFEIPVLRVNNSLKEGKDILGPNAIDAVGINKKVADQLSGADFDGDTVVAIPLSEKVRIRHDNPIPELVQFDPKEEYAERPGMKKMTKANTQMEMGKISNLITDMYTQGASREEIVRATKHSMVVIDAEKHHLDYKRSEQENDIQGLKDKYQKHTDDDGSGGASTIISRAKSPELVTKRQGSARINPDGSVWYKEADDARYINKKGEETVKKQKSTKMAETSDAYTLVSDIDNPIERAYASYANQMKSLANQARKTAMATKDIQYNSNAYKAYKKDVDDLLRQIDIAEANRPRERAAQTKANAEVQKRMKLWKEDNPTASKGEYKAEKKKVSQKEISKARKAVGAERMEIKITDRQWDAINQGAVHKSTLETLFKYADMKDIRQRAMPRQSNQISSAKQAQIKAMSTSGYSTAQIAEQLGISTSTVSKYLNGQN